MIDLLKDPWFWIAVVTGAINLAQHRWFKDYRKIIARYQQMLDEVMTQNAGLLAMNGKLLGEATEDPNIEDPEPLV